MDKLQEIVAIKLADTIPLQTLQAYMVTPGWWKPDALPVLERAIQILEQREALDWIHMSRSEAIEPPESPVSSVSEGIGL